MILCKCFMLVLHSYIFCRKLLSKVMGIIIILSGGSYSSTHPPLQCTHTTIRSTVLYQDSVTFAFNFLCFQVLCMHIIPSHINYNTLRYIPYTIYIYL